MAASSKSNVVVRAAGPSDYDAVMAVSDNIYDGMDYLPVLYHTFIHDPNSHMFVAEVNGKVVSTSEMTHVLNAQYEAIVKNI